MKLARHSRQLWIALSAGCFLLSAMMLPATGHWGFAVPLGINLVVAIAWTVREP